LDEERLISSGLSTLKARVLVIAALCKQLLHLVDQGPAEQQQGSFVYISAQSLVAINASIQTRIAPPSSSILHSNGLERLLHILAMLQYEWQPRWKTDVNTSLFLIIRSLCDIWSAPTLS
jgi:hypothetical protein